MKYQQTDLSFITSVVLAFERISLRRTLVWLLILAVFTHSNSVLADALAKERRDEIAQNRVPAYHQSSNSYWESVMSCADQAIPDFYNAFSLLKKAFYVVLPFDEEDSNLWQRRRDAEMQRQNEAKHYSKTNAHISLILPSHLAALMQPVSLSSRRSIVIESASQITDAAISRNRPSLNSGRIEGSLRVFSGENFTINGGMQITSDLYVIGTPQVIVNGGASHGGIIDGSGSSNPSNYRVALNGGVTLAGKIHRRADALALPSDIPSSVPVPPGTRTVNINSPSDVSKIGQWDTVRALNVNSSGVVLDVPPGNYGTFSLNGNSKLNFTAGTYNFSTTLNINGNSSIQTTGAVTINVAQSFNLNNGSILPGAGTAASDVRLNVLSPSFTLNGNSQITALVRAPNANASFNGNAVARGQVIAKHLNMNGGRIIGDAVAQTDAIIPTISITSPLNGHITQRSTITISGTVTDSGSIASGIASVRVNGADAVLDVLAGTWTATNVNLNTGSNTITAIATDAAGNQATATITIVRQEMPPPDSQAPRVTITSPANEFSTLDSSITVTGTALDEGANATGIARILVNGVEAVFDSGNNNWTATGIALTVGDNSIIAEAEDRAPIPNRGRAEITVQRRVAAPPQIEITNPQPGIVISATSITVAGTVTAGASDVTVVVTVNGEQAQIAGGQFTKTISLEEGSNSITIIATDSLGQVSQASAIVVSDITQPSVAFTDIPTTVQPGASYALRTEAFDTFGIASVEFSVNDQLITTANTPPFDFTLSVPTSAAPGQTIVITAKARDLAGASATDRAKIVVAGPGGISGYVFDDATGYGIESAMAHANEGPAVASDSTGAFAIISSTSSGILRIFKPAYTPVERAYSITPGGSIALFDARLTYVSSEANIINASGGTSTGEGGRISVAFGAGSFADGTDIRITVVSPQGLISILPFGWSPVPGAIVDVRRADASLVESGNFSQAANLLITETPGLAVGTQLVLARYDEASHRWTVIDTNAIAGANGSLAAMLPGAGQYAFLVADTGATAPPSAVTSQPLPAGPSPGSSALNAATCSAMASPRSVIISAEARSTISFVATSTIKLPSGTAIEANFGETYSLFDQASPLLVDRVPQDFVLYSYPAATTDDPHRIASSFVAKPTRFDFTIGQFRSGKVHVEIRSGRPLNVGALVGAGGGTVTGEGGSAQLDIPEGALASDTPVSIAEVLPEHVFLDMPAGYEIVGAADVDFSTISLATGAAISIPAITGDTNRIVVARLITVAGRRSPELVARAVASQARLVSTISAPAVPSGVNLPGVTVAGRYAFIRVPSAFGYLTGFISDSGSPSVMVRVSTDRTPFIDVTDNSGRYVTLGESGATFSNSLEAASLLSDATGEANVSLASQDSVVRTDLSLASVPLSITAITPESGAGGVTVTSAVTITFSKPVQASTITGSSIRLSTAAGNPVLGTINLLAGGRVAVVTPAGNLAGATDYRITVNESVRDVYGKTISAQFESTFTTAAAVKEDEQLRPEQISLSYPNSQGFATLIIPARAVPTGSTIVVVNNTTGSTVTRVAGLDEIRLEIPARVGDEIVVLIRQPDGTEYRVSQGAYRRDDGFTSVSRSGGVVISADGRIALSIPKNAITGQIDLRLIPKSENDITLPREGEMSPTNMPFAAGVEIQAEGNFNIERDLHLQLTAPASATPDQRVAFLAPKRISVVGQEVDVWETVTSGRVERGRLKSNSPPFTGFDFIAGAVSVVYAFLPVRQKVVFGRITEPASQTDSTPRPVRGALCVFGNIAQDGIANRLVARSGSDGFYSIFDPDAVSPQSSVIHVIDDTNGRRGTGTPVQLTGMESQFIQGLQGFETYRTDVSLAARSGESGNEETPPQITLTARSTSGPVSDDPLVQLGVVQVPAQIMINARTDRVIQEITGSVLVGDSQSGALGWSLIRTETGEDGHQSQLYSATFDASAEGSYRVAVAASTIRGNQSTATQLAINFVALRNPNTRPPLAGPPAVIRTTPGNGATDVDVAADIKIEFTEPVSNLIAGQTVYLIEDGQTEQIGGTLFSGGVIVEPNTSNISSIIFRPQRAFDASKRYHLHVTSDIKDTDNNPLDQEYTGEGDTSPKPFEASFTTFGGLILTDDPVAPNGFRVVVLDGLAIVLATSEFERSGINLYDISDPLIPRQTGSLFLPQRGLDIAASEEITYKTQRGVFTRLVAVVAHDPQRPQTHANVWFVSVDDQGSPKVVGVTSLYILEGLPTAPLSVQIRGERAYIGNSPLRGVIAVDIKKSLERFATFSDPQIPINIAATPGQGAAPQSKIQSVRYFTNITDPSVATSITTLEQGVSAASSQENNPRGNMHVVYAVDTSRKSLVSIGLAQSNDGFNDFLDTDDTGTDDRVFDMKAVDPPDGAPTRVKAVSGILVGGQPKDLALALGANRLWIFDVTDPVNLSQYPSRTFQEMGLDDADGASWFDVEGTLAYVVMSDRIVVIDFKDPANPRVVAVITDVANSNTSIAVKDGFIFTTSPGVEENDGLNVSIARPASTVFVHGFEPFQARKLCANPVIISRETNVMQQMAEVYFQIFGRGHPQKKQVIIRKNNDIIATINDVEIEAGTSKVVRGYARWQTSEPIDRSAQYTAEVVLDQNDAQEFHSKREPIPFSHLITDFMSAIGIEIANGEVTASEDQTFFYMLAASSAITITVDGETRITNRSRPLGLNVESGKLENSFPPGSGLAISKREGRYRLSLRAVMEANPNYIETVEATVIVSSNPEAVRPPGNIVIAGVDLLSGNLGVTATDIEIPGRGLSLSIVRAYNSLASGAFGPFGYGWRHNYQVLLTRRIDPQTQRAVLMIRGGDGEGQSFAEGQTGEEVRANPPHQGSIRKNADGSFDYFTKTRVRFHFPGAFESNPNQLSDNGYMGNLEYIEDTHGLRITLVYEESKLVRVIDSSSRALEFSYERALTPFVGFLGTTTLGGARSTCVSKSHFSLMLNQLLKAEVGVAWRINRITGPGGVEIIYSYDDDGNLSKVTRKGTDAIRSQQADDQVWNYSYKPDPGEGNTADISHLIKSVINPNNNAVAYKYNFDTPQPLVSEIVYPQQIRNTFTYTAPNGLIQSVEVTDGRETRTIYAVERGADGFTLRVATPVGEDAAQTEMRFNKLGLKVYERDTEGLETLIAYDARGNIDSETRKSVMHGDGELTILYEFESKFNKLTSITDPRGNTTRYKINDSTGDVLEVILPMGGSIRMSYQSNGDLASVIDGRGFATNFEYDEFGNATEITREVLKSPTQKTVVTVNQYDLRSRLLNSSSTLGPTTINTYDALDRVVSSVKQDPVGIRDGFETEYIYKPAGQVSNVAMSGGGLSYTIAYQYDLLERVVKVTEGGTGIDSLARTFTYDGNSNIVTATDRRGVRTDYNYNSLNFLTRVEVSGPFGPSDAIQTLSVTPDKTGNPKIETDLYGNTVTYEYDGFHRLKERRYATGHAERIRVDKNGNVEEFRDRNDHSTRMKYDPLNRISELIDAEGRKTIWDYNDQAGEVTITRQPQGLTLKTLVDGLNRTLQYRESFGSISHITSYSYDGLSVEITDPRGTVIKKSLSAFGETGRTELVLDDDLILKNEMRYSAFGGMKSYIDANQRQSSFTTDALGRITTAIYPTDVSEAFVYDGESYLISHTDRRGIQSSMTYDNAGRPLATRVGNTEVISRHYNNALRLVTETDSNNHSTIYEYDSLMRLNRVTNADGNTKTFEYDGVNLRAESDFKGKKRHYEYDEVNRLIRVKDRTQIEARHTLITHNDSGGRVMDVEDRRGNHRVETYDPLDRVIRVTDGGELLAKYEYDGNDNLTTIEDGRGNRNVYSYDRANRILSINRAGLHLETFKYDGVGNLLEYFDGRGGVIAQTFDELDRIRSRRDGEDNLTQYFYDGEGLLEKIIDPLNRETKYEYNDLRSLIKVTDARGGVWQYDYDDAQNLRAVRDALGRETRYDYDRLNRLERVTHPGSLTTRYVYDSNGNVLLKTDPLGQMITADYDDEDRLKSIGYALAGGLQPIEGPRRQAYKYDPEGNLTDVEETTALSGTIATRNYARTYDARNRLKTATDPSGRSVSYVYDAANNVTEFTDSAQKNTRYSYDSANRLDIVTLHSGRSVDYDWTADGLVSQVIYGSGMSRVYTYDNADRVTSIKNNLGGGDSEEYSYTYDANSNRRNEMRRQKGEVIRQVDYSYDELDRLTAESYTSMRGRGLKAEYFDNTDFTSLKETRIDSTLDFNWEGNPVVGVDAEGFSVRWTGRIEATHSEEYTFYARSDEGARVYINDQLIIDAADAPETRENSGRITLQAGHKYDIRIEYGDISGAAEIKLSWESSSQSKQVVPSERLYPPEINLAYSYDAVGNRLSEIGAGVNAAIINRAYRYDELNRLTEITEGTATGVTFSYDANGNLRTQTQGSSTTGYEYDLRDQLRRVTQGASEVARFDYDFERRRLSKTSFGTWLSYVYDGDRVVNEYGAAGQLVNRFDYGIDLVSGELGGEGDRFYYSDALGSITALSSIAGGVSAGYEYSAWGENIAAGASLNRIGYTGQRKDEETGLMALGSGERYYSSSLGQFIQQDSFAGFLSQPQSLNLHSYVVNNPTKHIDPSGHIAPLVVLTAIVIGALTGAAIGAVGGFIYGAGVNGAYQFADLMRGDRDSFSLRESVDAGIEGAKYGAAVGALAGALGAIGFGAAVAAGLFIGGALATAGSIAVNLEQGRWDYALIDTIAFAFPFKSAKGRSAVRDSFRNLGKGPRATVEVVAESQRTVGQGKERLRGAEEGIRRERDRWTEAWESSQEPERAMALAGVGGIDISGMPDVGRPARTLGKYLESRSSESRSGGRSSGRSRSEEVQSTSREAVETDGSVHPDPWKGKIGPDRQLLPSRDTALSRDQVANFRGTGRERGLAHNQHMAEWTGGQQEVFVQTKLGTRFHDIHAPTGTMTEMALEGKNYLRWRTVDGARIRGEVPLNLKIRTQVYKDVLWIRAGRRQGIHRTVQWDFPSAPPSTELANFLQRWGLPYVH